MSGRLRCWPGARAVVVKSKNGNQGRVVQCVRLAERWEYLEREHWLWTGAVWVIEPQLPTTSGRTTPFFPDERLTPITPPPGAESTTTDAAQPVEAA